MWNSDCSWWWGPGYFFGGPFGMILGFVFWAAIIYVGFRLISNLFNQSAEVNRKRETALDILKQRYAKGEIDMEEFTKIKKHLES